MTITKKTDGTNITLTLNGRLDTATAPILEKEVDELADATELVLDFKDVAYISSAGLRVILKAQKYMNKQGKMKLVNVNDDVMDVFDITGFLDILTIE